MQRLRVRCSLESEQYFDFGCFTKNEAIFMSVKQYFHCPCSSGGGEDSTERESPQRTDSNRSKPEGKEYTRGRKTTGRPSLLIFYFLPQRKKEQSQWQKVGPLLNPLIAFIFFLSRLSFPYKNVLVNCTCKIAYFPSSCKCILFYKRPSSPSRASGQKAPPTPRQERQQADFFINCRQN